MEAYSVPWFRRSPEITDTNYYGTSEDVHPNPWLLDSHNTQLFE